MNQPPSSAQRFLTFVALLVVSWVVMPLTHEIGHLLGGYACGATLLNYDLAPWRMPYSLHGPDPHPLVTLWAGPLLGIAIPLGIAWLLKTQAIWFVADFCLVANGVYLALAWISGDRFLDTPRLLAAGASQGSIAIYCCVTIGLGYRWFRQDCIDRLGQPSPLLDKRKVEDEI